jgi:hypothetical protein
LEALLPQIEEREKKQETERKARKDKMRLLMRASFQGMINPPARGKHWWSEKVCPICGSRLREQFVIVDDCQRLHWGCRLKSCGYEYISS